MAEAIVNYWLSYHGKQLVQGMKPTGYVHPKALAALTEIGIRASGSLKVDR